MKKFMTSFLQEEDGQGMAEYALVLGVIAVAVVVVLGTFGDAIIAQFDKVIENFTGDKPTG
jgi:pilus assembly protein Flp/PilA